LLLGTKEGGKSEFLQFLLNAAKVA